MPRGYDTLFSRARMSGCEQLRKRSEYLEPELSKCRSCGAEIVWVVTDRGKKMPVDPDFDTKLVVFRDDAGQLRATAVQATVSHFATCPNASKHRR